MTMPRFLSRWRADSSALVALALVVLSGCGGRPTMDPAISPRLSAEVWAVLDARRPFNEFHRARGRLQEMGPEVDAILVAIAENPSARAEVRSNALILLADRRSHLALVTMERALRFSENERIRSAAVLGLNRLSADSEEAMELIRFATMDRSRSVRLNALQSLDARDIDTMRGVLAREGDPSVLRVAVQLVSLAEARGAPLMADGRGSLRTASSGLEPQIVFRPVIADSVARVQFGDLRLEFPEGPDIPLVPSAKVVGDVVPAFFSPDRSAVVFEHLGEIRVLDVATRSVRNVAPGMAPRLIPFAHQFVYFREIPDSRREVPEGTEVVYEVLRSGFGTVQSRRIGELRAWLRVDRYGGESPVQWIIVEERADGFVLRGEGIETFDLPTPVWSPGRPEGPGPSQGRRTRPEVASP